MNDSFENSTFDEITRLANERHMLYRAGGHQPLNQNQRDRLSTIDNQLPVLWDQYRREVATETRQRELRQQREARETMGERIRHHAEAA